MNLSIEPSAVPSLLGDMAYEDPSRGDQGDLGGWVATDEYLSGNVRLKLAQARLAAVFFGSLDVVLRQFEGLRLADMNLDVRGHLPEAAALEEVLHALGEAVLVLLPVGHGDDGAGLRIAIRPAEARAPQRGNKQDYQDRREPVAR